MAKLYPGIAFSPPTTLTENIGAADTIIRVADASVFPPAPNYATIGTDEDGETIEYAAKADGLLSGCTRGVEGMAKTWQKGEVIARNFTAADHNSMISAATDAQQTADAAVPKTRTINGKSLSSNITLTPADIGTLTTTEINSSISAKQDKLSGSTIQVVGFDANGKAIAVSRWSNPNLLDNAYFGNPVNQRGQTEYTGNAYTIDRWYIYAGRLDIVRDSHIKITRNNMTDYFDLRQLFEDLNKDLVYTFSILSDGELYSVTGTFVSNPVTKTPFGEIMLSWSGGKENIVVIRPLTTDPVNITAAKLELGPIQTLAHQENGVWVLNEIPNYALERVKCQRYQFDIIGNFIGPFNDIAIGTTNNGIAEFIISLPTSMRARPSLNCDFSKIQIANVEANSYSYATNGEVMFASNAEVCIHFSCTTIDGKARLRSDNRKIILDANL